jgi:hypothetical protein
MKYCVQCKRNYQDNFNFCPECGDRLVSEEVCGTKYNLNPPYDETYGLWEVTTEGDCEGKSVNRLGIYEGHIDEIAFHLAHKCYYSLQFTRHVSELPKEPEDPKETPKSVCVIFDIKSGSWDRDMNSKKRVAVMTDLFKDRPVKITEGQYYASFVLEKV